MNIRSVFPFLCVLILGSCSSGSKLSSVDVITQGFADLNSTADSVIADSVRRENFLRATRQLESELRSFEEYSHTAITEFRSSFRNYDIAQDELMRQSSTFHEAQHQARSRFVNAHVAMAASVTADEWKVLAKKENKLLEDLRDAASREAL